MVEQTGPTGANPQNQTNHTTNLRPKIGEFWNRYDKLADSQDQHLIKSLNDDLDVILIFNKDILSVRTSWFLYFSLCCSILAAIGAMMAKEWLQSFKRDGQVSALQDQALRRQRKINGVLQWQLEPMNRLLPTLLLVSVVLFFVWIDWVPLSG